MKKAFLSVAITIALTLFQGAAAFGAVHAGTSEEFFFSGNILSFLSLWYGSGPFLGGGTFEKWFTVGEPAPRFEVDSVFESGSGSDPASFFRADYFQDDQTFAGITYYAQGSNPMTEFKGSYLLNCGLFAGVDYLPVNGHYMAYLSPGYRLSLGEEGYIAASADYLTSDVAIPGGNRFVSYELDGAYYPDNARIYGEIWVPNQDVYPGTDTAYAAGANFLVGDGLVCGLSYLNTNLIGSTNMSIITGGATYAKENLILNGAVTISVQAGGDTTAYDLGAAYYFSSMFGAGLEYCLDSDYGQGFFTISFHLDFNNGVLQIQYSPENDPINHAQTISAAYRVSF